MSAVMKEPAQSDYLPVSLEESNKFMNLFFATEPTMADMVDIQVYMETEMPASERVGGVTNHYFSEGLYCRETTIPAGVLVVGKRHAKSHMTFLMQGKATIVNDEGIQTVEGPIMWQDAPGVKRAVYAHSDATFVTAHGTQAKTPEEAEKELIVVEILGGNR